MKNTKNFFVKASLFVALLALILVPVANAQTFSASLKMGARGAEVTALQTFLAADSALYPQGLVTGYFGSLTKAAVIRFQIRNGLKGDGIVGPMTRNALNAQVGGGISGQAPTISGVYVGTSSNSATVSWNTDRLARGVVYYSINPLTTYEYENSVDVSGAQAMTDTTARSSQSVAISGLQPSTTYYYLIYSTGQDGVVSVTWPSTFRTN